MKSASLLKVAFVAMLFFFCTSSKPVKQRSFSRMDTFYYWYLDGGTVYDGWYSTSEEITRLEDIYGVYIDGFPDGTLIANGYFVKGYPHLVFPSVSLYTH